MHHTITAWKIEAGSKNLERVIFPGSVLSLDQATRNLPQGVYTSFRTYRRYFALHLDDHFQRLAEGAKLLNQEVHINARFIRSSLKDILKGPEGPDFRVRLSIDLEERVGDVYLMVEPLRTPPVQEYQAGVNVLTRPFQRENPGAKTTRFIQDSTGYRSLLSKEVNEVLLVNPQNEILEGLSSNFFGVIRGELFTAGVGILPGITRAIILDAAKDVEFEICLNPVQLGEIGRLDEAFLTSASRAVLPVRQIDQTTVGTGQPGPVSERLGTAFQARVEKELEEI